ncbi:hypothetical protein LTS18_000224, partial [Coniosporium uncinatum]
VASIHRQERCYEERSAGDLRLESLSNSVLRMFRWNAVWLGYRYNWWCLDTSSLQGNFRSFGFRLGRIRGSECEHCLGAASRLFLWSPNCVLGCRQ